MEKNLVLIKAKGAVLSHDFGTAARLYKMLLAEDPSNVEYLKQLGSIYVQNQEDEKAIPYYEQIITFYPHYIEAMNSLGAIYRRLGRYEESIAILQRAVDEGRDAASVNYNLGFTYKEMGNFDDAIDAFNLVVHENPDDVLAYNHLGRIYHSQKNYDKAIASYKRGLQIDQNHPILNYNLAHVYEATKNVTDAIRCYQAALKTRPGWVDAINDFSELLIKSQKNKEAQDLVQQSIKLHPTNADLLCLLGRIYLNQYDYSSAEKTFKQADSYKANDVKILTGLSEALEKGEKVDAALNTVLSALEIEPENKDIRKQYVHTLLTAKDYDEAFANVKALYEETEGKDLAVLDLYGQYYICKDQEEQAQQYYSKIQKQNHHYKDYMLGAASRYTQIGKLDKAESYANEYIERRPSNPEGYNVLGKIFENKGDLHKAIDSYNKSLNLRKPNVLADKKIAAFQTELAKQPEPVIESPAPVIEAEENIASVVETPVEQQEEAAVENEEFDYSMLGGNVPLQEGLVEDEKDFFDSLDEDKEVIPEDPVEEEKEDAAPEEEQPKFKYNTGDPKDVFDDDGIFDDDAAKKENDTLENTLKDAIDEVNNDDLASSLADASDDEPFDIFGSDPLPAEENEPAVQPASQPEPAPAPAAPAAPNYNPQPMDYSAQQAAMEQRMQQMAMDNAANAMEAAFTAQRMAQQLAEQQRIMQEQTQKALEETLEKVQNMQEEKMRAQDREIESLLDDENIVDETPAEEPVIPKDDFVVEEMTTDEPEETAEEVTEEIPVEEVITEEPVEEEISEEEIAEETPVEITIEETVEEEPVTEAAEEFTEDEVVPEVTEEAADESEDKIDASEFFDEDFGTDLDDKAIEDEFNFSEMQNTLDEELSLEGDPTEAEDVIFVTTADLLIELGEEAIEDAVVEEPVTEETPVADEPVIEEELVEEESMMEGIVQTDEATAAIVDDMLGKIERILSDDELAAEYAPQLELFKKLKILSEYLPESEKNTFLSCRMRMLIEYIISKMSGKPGLLSTATALLKSGVLGEEYNDRLNDEIESDDEVRNELIRVVLTDMKKMSQNLPDQLLADAMAASIDNILERIELEDQKSKIF